MSAFGIEERGSENSLEFRVFIKDDQGPISPLHDIPLWADKDKGIVNMIVEIPRWTNAKMEMSLNEPLNPIKQDIKKNALRYVANVFPHHGYMWNYGALPQTWENPNHVDPHTGAGGDNDPIDVLELGGRVAKRGEVIRVKIIGVLALLDDGETDWKLLAIDERDPLAEKLNNVADLEANCPGFLKATVEWFRLYKVPDGKPPNVFAFDGQAKDKDFAYKIVDEVHEFWNDLVNGKIDPGKINLSNVLKAGSSHRISREAASGIVSAAPVPSAKGDIPCNVDRWHFVANL